MHIPIKKSKTNKLFAGVIAGFAEHFGWNVALARVLYVVLTLFLSITGLGIIAYLVLWMLMEEPEVEE
ncbi:PspC domain-containing protein [Companilactobacillus furfuricola]|uniref:PspC domain-containing protein n=1 Tax=Companilactobacillus furfuricola TaxID=1462575 RepID=UPI000F7B3F1D|nr:PspC domain-containing protein [Companilactobacillus furfuricola]